MVEAVKHKNPTKRQKLRHVPPGEPAQADDSKTTTTDTMVLTNVNVEEYKNNPEEFENLREKRPVGA